jgi:hypothetical protein
MSASDAVAENWYQLGTTALSSRDLPKAKTGP